MTVYERLTELLADLPHEAMHHRAIRSAEDAAVARGTALDEGIKALVMKIGKVFQVVAVPADRRLHGASLRRALGVQRYRFARGEELQALTGLAPGSVPPVGHLFSLPLVVDEAVLATDHVVFTLGRPDRSARLPREAFLELARPDTLAALTEAP